MIQKRPVEIAKYFGLTLKTRKVIINLNLHLVVNLILLRQLKETKLCLKKAKCRVKIVMTKLCYFCFTFPYVVKFCFF